jgi:uncharacterized protein YegP (UPF0339 family)
MAGKFEVYKDKSEGFRFQGNGQDHRHIMN